MAVCKRATGGQQVVKRDVMQMLPHDSGEAVFGEAKDRRG